MIKVHNDGKGKYQSFRATYDLEFPEYPFVHCQFEAYGSTEEEAISELKSILVLSARQLQEVDFSKTVDVDWRGRVVS